MKTLRAIIIDDEKKGIDSLKLLIEKFVPGLTIVAHTTSANEAIELISTFHPEIVFLDINMPEMSGFELLEKLEWKEFNLVFTTAHQEYGLRALKNNAVDYLLKPIDHNDVLEAVERIKKRSEEHFSVAERFNILNLIRSLDGESKDRLVVNLRNEVENIRVDDIIYMESISNYTKIFLDGSREITTSRTLKEYDHILCSQPGKFMRIHNSFIINLTKVTRYLKCSESVVLAHEKLVPVSKSKKDAFYRWMDIRQGA